jgi:hypothetical protein
LTGEIAIEVTGVVGVSPALWYFRYIASIFLTLHKRLWAVWSQTKMSTDELHLQVFAQKHDCVGLSRCNIL